MAEGYLLEQTGLSHRRAHAHTIGFFCSLSLSLLPTNQLCLDPHAGRPLLDALQFRPLDLFFLTIFDSIRYLHSRLSTTSLNSTIVSRLNTTSSPHNFAVRNRPLDPRPLRRTIPLWGNYATVPPQAFWNQSKMHTRAHCGHTCACTYMRRKVK